MPSQDSYLIELFSLDPYAKKYVLIYSTRDIFLLFHAPEVSPRILNFTY